MMQRGPAAAAAALVLVAVGFARLSASDIGTILPSGWIVHQPRGAVAQTGTMPQGAALSSDGKTLAVVESGFNPPALHLFDASTLRERGSVRLAGAFGRPVWRDGGHVLVAGANADAVYDVTVATGSARSIALPKKSYPVAVALDAKGTTVAVATNGDGAVRIGSLDQLSSALSVAVGKHPAGLAFSPDGRTLFVSVRSPSYVRAIDLRTGTHRDIAVKLHPSDLLASGRKIYVAETDADEIGIIDPASMKRVGGIFVGDDVGGARVAGVSVNALSAQGNELFASLGAANSVAVIRGGRVVGRIDAGWYPTDVVPAGRRLFIINGKGERAQPNPNFDAQGKSYADYIAAIENGSVRVYDPAQQRYSGNPQGAPGWNVRPPQTIVRKDGPIRHVFFVLKENRSYDQVLGDLRAGNGDAKLVWFGRGVTPNQHALAQRFGLFDNTYANGEVSSNGHKWANSAFANDYTERFWPPSYGERGNIDDLVGGEGGGIPRNGFIWDAAARDHVTFRDYGELVNHLHGPTGPGSTTAATLRGRFDPRYVGWDLNYGDLDREREWRREFDSFLARGTVPQLEYIWLPNDHTQGSAFGKPTPAAYVAANDYCVGLIVEAISHSRIWKSSAVFVMEDDAQDGADHVSDQRTTLYVASPYARGGVRHEHYTTVGVLRTIELFLGMHPLSTYDAMSVPLYAAFSGVPDLRPFTAIPPLVSVTATNARTAYGARESAQIDFSRPDTANAGELMEIIGRNRQAQPTTSESQAR